MTGLLEYFKYVNVVFEPEKVARECFIIIWTGLIIKIGIVQKVYEL